MKRASTEKAIRGRIVIAAVLCGLVIAAASIALRLLLKSPPPAPTASSLVDATTEQPNVATSPLAKIPTEIAVAAPTESSTNQLAVTNEQPRSAQQIMTTLLDICAHKPITADDAEQFKQLLAQLIAQGDSSVPAIREFFIKNIDTDFVTADGGDQLSYASLRASMIDALKQIGGPEAQTLMRDTLQTTASPAELLALAQTLEQLSPGQYSDDVVKAANELMQMAAANQLGDNVELGPALRILNTYGTADMADKPPENVTKKLDEALTLAKLSDNGGLSSLIDVAQNSKSNPLEQSLASQMIAQLASQNDTALKSLIQMAGNGQIPNNVWLKIAPILAGDGYQAADGSAPTKPPTVGSPDQINQRISMIDLFLGTVSQDSAAAAALKQQRNILSSKLQ